MPRWTTTASSGSCGGNGPGRTSPSLMSRASRIHCRQDMRVPEIHTIRAEPLTADSFRPFGQVLASELTSTADATIELRGGEIFHLNVLSYDRRPLRCDHLNAHHKATQALFALGGKPTLLVVAPAAATSADVVERGPRLRAATAPRV